jgi:hypothetical protein
MGFSSVVAVGVIEGWPPVLPASVVPHVVYEKQYAVVAICLSFLFCSKFYNKSINLSSSV